MYKIDYGFHSSPKCQYLIERKRMELWKNCRDKNTALMTCETFCSKKDEVIFNVDDCDFCDYYKEDLQDIIENQSRVIRECRHEIENLKQDWSFFMECLDEVLDEYDIDSVDFFNRLFQKGWY